MTAESAQTAVWVFSGNGGTFPGGMFSNIDRLEAWVSKHGLSGMATLYHVDTGAYDWSVENGFFKPHELHHSEPEFIRRFAGGQEHYHYENGERR